MSQEQAFLDHLAANPGDDLTRLVYADWLEEHGDPRGAYLRAEQELARTAEGAPSFGEGEADLRARCRDLDPGWLAVAGRRWDVWLTGYSPQKKIAVIKVLRELTGCGLAEAKTLSESLPCRVLASCPRHQADAADEKFDWCRAPGHFGDEVFVRVSIRPCPEPSAAVYAPFPEQFEVVLLGHRPRRKTALIRALRERFHYGADHARRLVEERLPHPLRRCPFEAEARAVAESLGDCAEVEVRRFQRPPVPVPPAPRPLPAVSGAAPGGSAPFVVRLLRYPADRKIHIIKAIRELTGVSLLEAKARSETTPTTLYAGVAAAEAQRVRDLFLGLGAVVEVGSAVP